MHLIKRMLKRVGVTMATELIVSRIINSTTHTLPCRRPLELSPAFRIPCFIYIAYAYPV